MFHSYPTHIINVKVLDYVWIHGCLLLFHEKTTDRNIGAILLTILYMGIVHRLLITSRVKAN